MGERSGAGLAEVAIMNALDSLGARPGRRHVRNARVLAAVEEHIGLAPGYAYQVLADQAQPWTVPVTLVDGQGNFGSRGNDPPAHFRYTEARLSPAGQVALAAERGELAPVPVGIINGSTYRDGARPPFRPQAIIEALRQVIRRARVSSKDLIEIIGPPDFLTGCTVSGDLAALAAGRPTVLRLQARVTISRDRSQVVIENIPPNISTDDASQSVADRARQARWASEHPGLHRAAHLPLRDLRDVSTEREPFGRFVCIPETGTPPEVLRDRLMDVYGVSTTMTVALPRPLAAMVRGWVRAFEGEDLLASLAALEDAIRDP
jgi:DNA gyrase/topoisomerase IV subunit A